jgi:hypothetical protein
MSSRPKGAAARGRRRDGIADDRAASLGSPNQNISETFALLKIGIMP